MNKTTDVFGHPRYYKDIPIHPIQMIDFDEFNDSAQCLLLPKGSFNDVETLKMSYLTFLINVSLSEEFNHYLDKLFRLLRLVLKVEDVQLNVNDREKFEIIINNDFIIRERDFDKIKTIVSEQNLIDLDDEFINPEVRAQIMKARAFMTKRAGKSATIDQQIIAYHCMTGLPYREIEQLTVFQFNKGLARYDHMLSSEAIMNARMSGMVEFKDESKLPHWLGHIDDKNSKDDLIINAEQFKTKATKELGMASK